MRRLLLLVSLGVSLGFVGGCTASTTPDAPTPVDTPMLPDTPGALPDGGGEPVPSPDGAGVCCPMDLPSCDCFHNGGFATSASGCDFLRVCDAAPPSMIVTDEHGCPRLVASGSCLARDVGGGSDAGTP